MKKAITSFSALLLLGFVSHSQLVQAYGIMETSQFRCNVSSTGDLFNAFGLDSLPGFEIPAGGGVVPVYAANLWIGGVNSGQMLRLAAETFEAEGRDWYPGPLTNDGSASISPEQMQAYDRVWHANAADVQTHIVYINALLNGTVNEEFPDGYTMPAWMSEWPAHGNTELGQDFYLAPFYDHPSSQLALYDPENGDYPLFCGDQCLYFIFNDKGGFHAESMGEPIGLEVHGMLYAFDDAANEMLNNTAFLKYKIKNQGTYTLADASIGLWADLDLGNPGDDYVGSDVARGAFFIYNGDELDEESALGPGYGIATPRFAVQFLDGLYMDEDAMDNELPGELEGDETYAQFTSGFEDGVIDNERIGLSSFRSYAIGANPVNGDPTEPMDYYNYLGDQWKDDGFVYYGGNGVEEDGVIAGYMYPGESDPLFVGTSGTEVEPWTEETAGNLPGDRRVLGTCGPVIIHPGDINYLEIAFVFAEETGSGLSEEVFMQNRLDEVRAYYNEYLVDCMEPSVPVGLEELSSQITVSVHPLPANNDLNVLCSNQSGRVHYRLLDTSGRVVSNGTSLNGNFQLDTSALTNGLYFLELCISQTTLTKKIILNH